jgi:hypothetical protein
MYLYCPRPFRANDLAISLVVSYKTTSRALPTMLYRYFAGGIVCLVPTSVVEEGLRTTESKLRQVQDKAGKDE